MARARTDEQGRLARAAQRLFRRLTGHTVWDDGNTAWDDGNTSWDPPADPELRAGLAEIDAVVAATAGEGAEKSSPPGRTGERDTTVLAHHLATLYVHDNGYDLLCSKREWARRVVFYACEREIEGAAELDAENPRLRHLLDGHRQIMSRAEKSGQG